MAAVYEEDQVNTFTSNTQETPAVTALTGGGYVVVWASNTQDPDNTYGIYSQRYSASGVAVGGELRVNTATVGAQVEPKVVGLSNGGYVVVWTNQAGTDGSLYGVYAQRYDASGVAQGTEFLINTTTSSYQDAPEVAAYNNGFVVSWESYQQDGSVYGVYAQRFDNTGAKVLTNGVNEFRVNTTTAGNQIDPDMAARADGSFVVVWTDQNGTDGSSYGVYAQRYDTAGLAQGAQFRVNTTTANSQYEPAVTMLAGGGFVVVWRADSAQDGSGAGVYAQIYNASGAAVGGELLINESTGNNQYQPDVVELANGGFAVTWYNDNYGVSGAGSYSDVYVREFSATGVAVDGEQRVNTSTVASSVQSQAVIAHLGSDNYVVVYTSGSDPSDGSGNGVYQQLFGTAAELPRQTNPEIGDFTGTVTFAENLVNATPQVIDAAVSLTDPDSTNFAGGRVELFYVQDGAATDQLGVRNQGVVAGQIGVSGANVSYGGAVIGTIAGGVNGVNLAITLNASATVEAVEALIQNLTYATTSQSPLPSRMVGIRVSDGDGGSSESSTVTINVTNELDQAPAVYGQDQVNTFTSNTQETPAVTALTGGGYVVVWASNTQDPDNTYGIYSQRYSASGVAVGGELRVNTATVGAQVEPKVVGLSNGGYVVVWTNQAGTDGSLYGVYAQRYDASGVAQGTEFLINTTTSSYQDAPEVAAYNNGFVVSWESYQQDGSVYGVYAQRFDNTGAKVLTNGVNEFRVNTTTAGNQIDPDMAARADGSFVVVWTDQNGTDGSSYGVYAQRYDTAGLAQGAQFRVNTTTANSQYEPAVTMLAGGGFVVVWRADSAQDGSGAGVYAQIYNASGAAVGGELLINESTGNNQYQPDVVGLANGGFAVTWYNDNYGVSGAGSYSDVYVREFSATGVAVDGEQRVNTSTVASSVQSQAVIAHLGSDNYVVVYTSGSDPSDGSGNGVYQQLFGTAAELPRQTNPEIGDFTGTVTFAENLVNATPQVIDAAVSLTDPDSTNFAGGRVELFYVQDGAATDQLGVRNQGVVAGQIGVSGANVSYGGAVIGTIAGGVNGVNLAITLNASATVEAVEALIQNLTYATTSQSPLPSRMVGIRVSDGDGGSSESSTVTINVTNELDQAPAVYGQDQVNTFTSNTQETPAVTALTGGGYVVVWASNTQDPDNTYGIYSQRYSASGVAVGGELRVNTATVGAQVEPKVVGLSNGGYIVVWTDQNSADGNSYGVYAQRYDANGVAQGAQSLVNTTTSSVQYEPSVADYNGGFVVTWASITQDGSGYGIYAQRFDNTGAKVLTNGVNEFRVNTATVGSQLEPEVAARADGSFVVVWTDQNPSDGDSYGVYAQRYDTAGLAQGAQFRVNTTTANSQYEPTVTMLAGGGFVVVWRSDGGQDGSGAGVYAQIYNASGAAVGGELLINESTANGQYQPDVVGLANGGFAVTWYNDNYGVSGAGSYSDVYVREFSATGVAVDGEQRVNTSTVTSSVQSQAVIAHLGSDNYVVVYTSGGDPSDGSGNGVYQQLFGTAAELPRQTNPEIGDFTGTVTFAENLVNATPQVIDAAVSLTDPDSANFAGGRVELFYVQDGAATDQLGVRNQGTTAGQIGVSGANVSYGGAVIGTIAGGVNGASLAITLNASATVEAVEALIQNLTYATTSQSPLPSRMVGIRVSDGDGGSSESSTVTINVTNELDQAPAVYGQDQVNTFTTNAQDSPAVATLTGGSYVVVWRSQTQDPDGSYGIYSQRYTTSGVAVGAEARVNTTTVGVQDEPQVTGLSNGGYIVVWTDQNSADGNSYGVYAQRYDANGVAQGAQSLVNTTTSSVQYEPSVADYNGGFVVTWASITQDGSGYGIYAQRFDNTGAKVLTNGVNEFRVNTATVGSQLEPEVAARADGSFVVVWTDQNPSDGDSYGVYAQRYDTAGLAQGAQFRVNTTTANSQYEPTVTMLAGGGFVVVWRSDGGQDGSGAGVYAQIYNASGAAVGGELLINESTANGQYQPDVVGLANGGFAVTWYNDNYGVSGAGSYSDVYVREFSATGVAVDGEQRVNTSTVTSSVQSQAVIAHLGSDNYVVVYTSGGDPSDGSGNGVYQQLFGTAAELPRPSAVPVIDDLRALRTLTSNAADPLYAGNPQLIDADVDVNDGDSANFAGGQLTVTLNNAAATEALGVRNQGTGAGQIGVSGANVSYGGTVIGTIAGGGAGVGALTITLNVSATPDATRALIENVTYQNTAPTAGDHYISFRLTDGDGGTSAPVGLTLRIAATFTPPVVLLDDIEPTVSLTEAQAQAGVVLDDGVELSYTGATGFNNGSLTVSYQSSTGRPDDQLSIRNEGNAANQVGVSGTAVSFGGVAIGTIGAQNGVNGANLLITFNASATAQAIERVIENLSYRTTSDGPNDTRTIGVIVRDGSNVASTQLNTVIQIAPQLDGVSPLFGEHQVNTFEAGDQTTAQVGRLYGSNDGGYVVVWASQGAQDGEASGVYAQRYDANGSAVGPEFQVNTETTDAQTEPTVAGLQSGGFVVAWTSASQDGSGTGIYAQRYDATGAAVGSEFRVNTSTTSTQSQPAVVGLSDGTFVVAFSSVYTGAAAPQDVLAQRYAANGTPLGSEFTLNTFVSSDQGQPRLAALAGGGFVATWNSNSVDGNGYGVSAQRFANDGSKVGGEIVVNTTTAGHQYGDGVAALAGGGFVVTWWSTGSSIYAQRFDAAGAKVGSEILVSTTDVTVYSQYARVAALATGGFVVTWDTSNGAPLGGNSYDVIAQQFDASGNRVDGPTVMNANAFSGAQQWQPDVVGLTGSNFVLAWTGYNQERAGTPSSDGVFTQLFGTPGSLTQQSAPVLVDVRSSVTFEENAVNAAPQIIDSGVGVADSDSANFAGGQLIVSVITGYGFLDEDYRVANVQADQLGVRNEGGSAGQVGVSGANVTFGGVTVATIVQNGANGNDLVLQFNASATPEIVERIIENLTYANATSAPAESRTVSIQVSDGDGGTSEPRFITVNINPNVDGGVALFGEHQVNTFEAGDQTTAQVGRLYGSNDGGYVVVWASQGAQDGEASGVYAQRYDANGSAVGPEFQVNTETTDAQTEPTVAGLQSGGFVVAWTSASQDGSGTGIYAQRYDATGAAVGSEFRVNTSTTSTQSQPAVVGLSDGTFVVAFSSVYTGAAAPQDVLAQRYAANGTPLGSEFTLNTFVSSDQGQPRLAALAGGGFVATWNSNSVDGNGYGVSAQRFANDGSKVGGEIVVNTTTAGHQYGDGVAALAGGGFVVTWWSTGSSIYAQRFDAAGAKVGSEILVSTTDVTVYSQYARVAALATGGFVVTWDTSNGAALGGNSYDVIAQQFDASGNRVDGPTVMNANAFSGAQQWQPDVVGLTGSNFVLAWTGYNQERAGTPSSDGVFTQLFGTPGSLTQQSAPVLVDVRSSVTFEENAVNAAPQIIDSGVGVIDSDSADFAGGRLTVSVITGYGSIEDAQLPENLPAQDQIGVNNAGAGPGQVGVSGANVTFGGVTVATIVQNGANGNDLVLQFNASATAVIVEHVIENLTYANTSSAPVESRTLAIQISDGDGATSEPRTITVHINPNFDGAEPLFADEQVNTYLPDTQNFPSVARLADGGYVMVWESDGQDGWGYGVRGQRFDANGIPVGSEFAANTYTPNNQTAPTVTSLTSGGFVVLWQSTEQDGSGEGIFGQRFDANAVPQGGEFQVNVQTSSNQDDVDAAGLAGGGFMVVWSNYYDGTNYYQIMGQRYGANGAPVGSQFTVNTSTGFQSSQQYEPSVASFADGRFVVTWTSQSEDGNGTGIYAQRFNSDGTRLGAEVRVNTFVTSNQFDSDVAVLSNGGFVVTWTSQTQDGGASYGVYAQRYDAAGNAVGPEFRVNTTIAVNENEPAVSALSTGGFVIAWSNGNTVWAQQYDANGVRVDGETRVDSVNVNYATHPAVAALANGAFVVGWEDYPDASGNSYGIFQRMFGDPNQLTRQANPELVDVTPSVTFLENTINSTPQVIDAGVGLFDADSPNFAGGVLEVNYLTDYGAQDQLGLQGLTTQDQLGIRSDGSAVGQVGVAGNVVSYGGVAIGTIISGGANGAKLTVSLNVSATAEAVEQVIENLTYANTASNPIASRTVSIRVTDGDGGASTARSVTINVTPEIDGAVRYGLERVVNTTVVGNQSDPSISHVADGGYVVVWVDQNAADGNLYGVYGQRYDANDNAVGAQFRVNTTTANYQYEAKVAGLNGGGYVVTWRSDAQDGSGAGVYAQRYNADGSAAGAEFRVNTTTTSNQYQAAIAATADGGFVIAWYHDSFDPNNTSDYYNVYFQRYNASGAAQGGQIRATPPAGIGSQAFEPSIAGLEGGGIVVVWTETTGGDGSGYGVFGQVFNASGGAVGGLFQVNTYVDSTQDVPSIAALADGGFIVTWESSNQDLSGIGIYAQRFDAAGAEVGPEFRVNTTISGSQSTPAVAALENGGWVITWYDGNDVRMQQYNAAGVQIDGETVVNSNTYSTQYQPTVTSMPDGGFVVAYSSFMIPTDGNGDGVPDGGNNTYEIRVQRFSNTAPTTDDVNLAGVQEDTPFVLQAAPFEAAFHDADGQVLQAIKVTTLPGRGTLTLGGAAVVAGQEISVADLQAGHLVYQGNADVYGLDQFRWTGSDGITFASSPSFANLTLSNVNDPPGLEAGADGNGSEGSFFSHAIALADPDPDGHQLTISWGDGTANQVVTTSSPNPSIGHTYADNGNYTVTVTANDQQGQPNSTATDSFQVAIANVAPTIALSGNNNVLQGDVYTLTLGDPSDPGADTVTEYQINWGDGSAVQIIAAGVVPANRQITHSYASSGALSIAVGLKDEDGTFANAGTRSLTVSPPAEIITVDAGQDVIVNEGFLLTRTINFTDPTDQGAPGRSYSINWGDGTTTNGSVGAGATSFNISHAFADGPNNYIVGVTVDDSGAQQGSDSFAVAVNNVAPTVPLSGAGVVNEGSAYTLTIGTPNDPGSETVSQYTVHWGDGVDQTIAAAALPANRQLAHTYGDGLVGRTIVVDLVDDDGTWLNAGTHDVTVNNVAPAIAIAGADTVAEGAVYSVTLGPLVDPGVDTPTAFQINWGDGLVDNYTPAQYAALGGTASHTYADGASGGTGRTVSVLVTDDDGTFTAGTKSLTVTNTAPSLALAGAAATNEGATYTLGITGSDPAGANDPLSYDITWGDGSAVQTVTAAQLALASGSVTHVYADDSDVAGDNATARTISVTATDGDGGSTTQARGVTVNNVAPTIAVSGAATATQGTTYTLTLGAVTDPGTDTVTQYLVNWGDGNSNTYTTAGAVTHTYAAAGGFNISVSLTDDDGTFANAGGQAVTVNAPTTTVALDAGADAALNEGQTLTRTITFSDGADNGAAGWGYSIDYGDGSAAVTGTTLVKSLDLSHLYTDGTVARTVTVMVTDVAGETATDSFLVNVANVAPSAPVLSGNAATDEGSSYTLGIAASTDPAGANDPLSYAINWGDGSAVQTVTAAQLTAASGNVTHAYADDSDVAGDNATARTISVTVSDGDGGSTTATRGVTVNNVVPSAFQSTVGDPSPVNEGSVFTLFVGAVTDPGTDTRTGYSINWGDGNTDTFTPAQWTAAAGAFTHTFADGGAGGTVRNVVVSATDEDGTFVISGWNTTVLNVAPSAPGLSGNAQTNEGATYTLGIAASTDPAGANDPLSYDINWGDGTAVQTVTAAQLAAASASVTHVYADDSDVAGDNATPRTISVTANDGDGGSTTATRGVTVNNVAPTAAVSGADTVNEGSAYTLNVGAVVDPGTDTRAGYSINWGDGDTDAFTAAQWTAAAGSFTHTYADGGTTRNVVVTATDEDGTFTLGGKTLTVANVAPSAPGLSGNAATNEGATYTLGIAASTDPAGASDPLSYDINWGDGSAVQTVTAAQLAAASGNVTHVYADDSDVAGDNATARTISVTASDGDGGSTTVTRGVTVNDVAPTIAVAGAATATQGTAYSLTLGAVTDSGVDTVSQYLVNWGDGNTTTHTTAGAVTHTYAGTGAFNISVSLVDEDGTHANAGAQAVQVNAPATTVALEAGVDAAVNEGQTFTRTIAFSDGADNGAAGWGYSIDYGDGSAAVTGTTTVKSLDLSHLYADGTAARTVMVTVTDVAGETATDSFVVNVANVAPTAAVTGANTVNEGSVYTLSVGAVSDPGTDTRTGYSIAWGDGVTNTLTAAQWTTAAGSFTHTYADGGAGGTTRNVVVSATDEDGTFTLGTKGLTVNNAAPTLTMSGAAATNEAATYTLGLSGTDPAGANDTLSYAINWGDGSAVQTVAAAQLAALGGNVTHVYADDQDGAVNTTPHTLSVTVSDEDGGSATDSLGVNVNNVAPTIAVAGAATATQGTAYTLTLGAVTDPGPDTVTQYVVFWGDGNIDTYTTAGAVTHTYAGTGNFNISVALTDEDGTHTNAGAQSVTVGAATPTLALEAGADAVLNEGQTFTRTIAFSDGADNGAAGWGYSIDYGDGTAAVTGTTTVKSLDLSHVYADGTANRTVTVTVTDVAGESATDSFLVNVANVAPSAPGLSGNAATNEGATYTLGIAASTDAAGANDPLSYAINWGDGSAVQTATAAQLAAASGNVTHVYADDSDVAGDNATARTISVTVSDGDGGSTTATRGVTVNNVAPTAAVTGADTVNEGSAYTLNVGAVADPGTDTRSGYSIDWGDGTAAQTFTSAQWTTAAGSFNHVYADGANGGTTRNVVVSATDEDGTFVLGGKTLTVANVAPSAPGLSGNAATNEGATYTLGIAASTDPAGASDPLSYAINWGDGSAVQTVTAAQLTAASGNVTHVYADDSDVAGDNATARTISVTASDGDGGSTTVTRGVTVNDVAPTIAVAGAATATQGTAYSLTLGAVTDPGVDTVSQYLVNWGDGNTTTHTTAGAVTHTYAGTGAFNISVSLVDEDGTHANAGAQAVQVNAPTGTVTLEAGADAAVNEGQTFTRTIAFSDGADNGAAGWGYSIDYGDGTAAVTGTTTVKSLDLSHLYADGTATRTVTVTVTDVAGETATDSFLVNVANVAPSAPVLSGNAATDEGSSYTLGIAASTDPAGANDPLSYAINWGDGSAVETVTAAQLTAASGNVTHAYADDSDVAGDNATARTISVTASDGDGGSTTATRGVTVNNVAPTAAVTGADTVNEGSVYTLTVGPVSDPGTDTRTGYSVAWGDGVTQTLTAAQWTAAAGNFAHTYADGGTGGTTRNVVVSATDEDGTFTLGSKTLTVANVAPSAPGLSGNAATNEGATYTLGIAASTDPAGAGDPLSYAINWGDGSAVQTVTAAQLTAASGNVTHVYADDSDAAGNNATARTISVTASDGDGGSTTATRGVTVNDVAPTIAVAAAATATQGTAYTLTLGAVTDPGTDTVSQYLVNWGDGNTTVHTTAGAVTHTYAGTGAFNISVSLVDEDGTHANTGGQAVTVSPVAQGETVRIGDAPVRLSSSAPNAWVDAWTHDGISITHKANAASTTEAPSAVALNGNNAGVLSGGDISTGDLGVSGQTMATSTLKQEIDGTEQLRFDLNREATEVTIDLGRFYRNDDGSAHHEAARIQLLDDHGAVVAEQIVTATAADGDKTITLGHADGFSAVTLTAGAYNDHHEFVFGAYVNDSGQMSTAPYMEAGKLHGSDYIVDFVEFEFPPADLVGVHDGQVDHGF